MNKKNTHFDMFLKIKACVGVIYFLVCVGKHEYNLPTNIPALFYDSMVCFLLPMCVCVFYQWCCIMFFITTLCFCDFCKIVLVKNTHLAKVWFDFPLPNAINVTLVFMWYLGLTTQ